MKSFEVCSVGDLKDGELKDFELNDEFKILMLLKNGKYYATSTKCTHYGAPLIKGSLCGTKVRCPWHGACFDLVTGDIEDYPGCDSLASYQTEVKGDKICVSFDPSVAKTAKRPVKYGEHKPEVDKRTFIVVGGGAAGYLAVQTLRENGFKGRLIMVSAEKNLPYDRVKLSKMPDIDPSKIALRTADFYKSASIELMMENKVEKLDTAKKEMTLSNGNKLNFDALLIATGGRPKALPGSENVKGVHVLRSPEDGQALVGDSKGKDVVIVGAGFIGLELAGALVKNAASLTLLGRSPVPLSAMMGDEIGKMLLKVEESNGVKYLSGVSVRELKTSKGALTGVVLTDGKKLQCNVLLMSIGIDPATEFLKDTGVQMTSQGFIEVDQGMKTNLDGIYAAGDIVYFSLPLNVTNGVSRKAHIGHWGVAQQMGKVAALNMLGREGVVFRSVPFFFTMVCGKGIRFAGDNSGGFSDVIIYGDIDNYKFVAYFVDKNDANRICAVSTLGNDPIASHFASLVDSGRQLLRKDVDESASWINMV